MQGGFVNVPTCYKMFLFSMVGFFLGGAHLYHGNGSYDMHGLAWLYDNCKYVFTERLPLDPSQRFHKATMHAESHKTAVFWLIHYSSSLSVRRLILFF